MISSFLPNIFYAGTEVCSNRRRSCIVKNLTFCFALTVFSTFIFTFSAKAQVQTGSNYYQQGLENLNRQDFAAAARFFQIALQTAPENEKARRGLAIALIGIEKFPEASRELAKLLAHSPRDPNLLEMAAQSFRQQNRFVEAEIVLRRRLNLGDERAELWTLLGDVLDAQKKTAVASTAYENAVRLAPDSIDFRYALGSLYWKQIRYDAAEKEFLEILRRQPNEPRASFNLGDIYLTNGEAVKAVPFLEIAVKNFPGEFDTHFALGRAYLLTNKYQTAIERLEIAVRLRPEIAEGFYQLGLALQKNGRREDAKTAFKKAQELQKAQRDSEAPKIAPKNNR